MVLHGIPKLIGAASLSLMSGCSVLMPNKAPSSFTTSVNPVMTEYSEALRCVGQLIDGSHSPPLIVYVRDIADETVPEDYRSRRLSKGGAWWFHTAISKMQSQRVTSTIKMPKKSQLSNMNLLVLSGAWTQDDIKVGSRGAKMGYSNSGNGLLKKLGWGKNQQASVIAGDFVSTVNDKVTHASAISLVVMGNDNNYELRIDDGDRRLDLGLTNEINEGPQFAQRRIAESAALVHVARAFNVDYRTCMAQEWASPDHYREQVSQYLSLNPIQQYRRVQKALSIAGYYQGKIDGMWGAKSKSALNQFLLDRGMAASGKPSAHIYGILIRDVAQQ